MNILFVTKELPYPPDNGCRNRTLNILKGLSKNNAVTLLCFGSLEKDKKIVDEVKKTCTTVQLVPEKASVSRARFYIDVFLGFFSLLPFAIKNRFSPLMKDEVSCLLRAGSIDLVFCDSIYQSAHIPMIKCAKVLSEHNIESNIICRYFKVERNMFRKTYAFIEWLKMRNYETKMWQMFNHCFVVSEKDKMEISSRSKNKNIGIVSNGVDINYFYPKEGGIKPFNLIYMGQMNWYPNHDASMYFLKEIYPLVKKQIPQVSLCIVGSSPSKKIKELAKNDNSVTITDYVDDTRPYIAQSEIFTVPLRIGSGTRLKILEAMAMAKPVISTSIGCEGLDVTDGENILTADRPEEFAAMTVGLFKNISLRNKIGIGGRRLVEEQYNWDSIIEELNRTIESAGQNYGRLNL